MPTLRELEKFFAQRFGLDDTYVRSIARRLVDAGYLPKGGAGRSGTNAAQAHPDHAAVLLMALATLRVGDASTPIELPNALIWWGEVRGRFRGGGETGATTPLPDGRPGGTFSQTLGMAEMAEDDSFRHTQFAPVLSALIAGELPDLMHALTALVFQRQAYVYQAYIGFRPLGSLSDSDLATIGFVASYAAGSHVAGHGNVRRAPLTTMVTVHASDVQALAEFLSARSQTVASHPAEDTQSDPPPSADTENVARQRKPRAVAARPRRRASDKRR